MNSSEQRPTTAAVPAAEPPRASTVTLLPHTEEQPRFQQSWPLNADATAASKARVLLRTWLTMTWDGNVDQGARVAGHLAENAVRHGEPLQPGNLVFLRVFVLPDTNELAIGVEDALPEFPGFEEHATQSSDVHGPPGGLWWVGHYHGGLSWDVTKDDCGQVVGKTVQALIPATWDGAP
ncbi:hypothetical protein ACGFS9_30265 [Streptomyces sp. NPDC048566]|uniref:hypothetical protein n=1 Tax=Streptomyces sp. NPDC048566 TaxID=3365569 RepID=UPI00371FC1AD